jgi:murein DD-endopeptidase MepM/ murein hydrolase activator NlpD
MSNNTHGAENGKLVRPVDAGASGAVARTPGVDPAIARNEISFNAVAKVYDDAYLGGKWLAQREQPSPFLTPDTMQRALDGYHTRHGLLWSYGGYLENRTELWRGSYLSCLPGEFLHAGIDINLPAKSPVVCTRGGIVRVVGHDCDTQGGWGPYVVVETHRNGVKEFALYAHLGGVSVHKGEKLEPFAVIGETGAPPQTGGWWSHLHIQLIEERYFMWCHQQGLMDVLDGYFEKSAEKFYRPVFPDPVDLVWDPELAPRRGQS